MEIQCSLHISSAMAFVNLASDIDVNYFTGFKTSDVFIFQIEQEQCITGQGYQIHQVIYHPQENLKM